MQNKQQKNINFSFKHNYAKNFDIINYDDIILLNQREYLYGRSYLLKLKIFLINSINWLLFTTLL